MAIPCGAPRHRQSLPFRLPVPILHLSILVWQFFLGLVGRWRVPNGAPRSLLRPGVPFAIQLPCPLVWRIRFGLIPTLVLRVGKVRVSAPTESSLRPVFLYP